MPPALSISKIGQIALNAKNIPAAAAFYRDVLGLKHLFSVGDRMAFFDCGGVRLMLSQPSRPELDHPSSILYFLVADIHAAHAKASGTDHDAALCEKCCSSSGMFGMIRAPR